MIVGMEPDKTTVKLKLEEHKAASVNSQSWNWEEIGTGGWAGGLNLLCWTIGYWWILEEE